MTPTQKKPVKTEKTLKKTLKYSKTKKSKENLENPVKTNQILLDDC
jgi:hypothetical protein